MSAWAHGPSAALLHVHSDHGRDVTLKLATCLVLEPLTNNAAFPTEPQLIWWIWLRSRAPPNQRCPVAPETQKFLFGTVNNGDAVGTIQRCKTVANYEGP